MPVKIVKINSETFPAIADAIRAKTGITETILPSQMAGKINEISTGELPELSNPAGAVDVMAGKEFISQNGQLCTGEFVDQIDEVERVYSAGLITVEVESTAGANKTISLADANLQPHNIVRNVSIFGVKGTAFKHNVETGTFNVNIDSNEIRIDCSEEFNFLEVRRKSGTPSGKDYIDSIHIAQDNTIQRNYHALISVRQNGGGIIFYETNVNTNIGSVSVIAPFIAGCSYEWKAYYM